MENGFLKELKSVLLGLGFASAEISLEQTSSGKVGGHIISAKFEGDSQILRQKRLWKDLAERLSKAELGQIVAILTVTPEEIGEDD